MDDTKIISQYQNKMKLFSIRFNKLLFYLIAISLSIAPAFALSEIDNRNFILIGMMGLGTLLFLFSTSSLSKIEYKLVGLLLTMFLGQLIFHRSSIDFFSLLYTGMFITYFMLGIRAFIYGEISNNQYTKLCALLIRAHFFMLLIQQLCVLMDLPVLNAMNISPLSKWKLNALSAEPSHTAHYITVLMYSFLKSTESETWNKKSLRLSFSQYRSVWIPFLWIMLTSGSGTSILFTMIILSRYLKRKTLIWGVIGIILLFAIAPMLDMVALNRVTTFASAASTLDIEELLVSDHSAAQRVVPFLLCISKINIWTLSGWIGQGQGYVSSWLSDEIAGIPEGSVAGGMGAFALQFGLFVTLIYMTISLQTCYESKNKLSSILIWFFTCAMTVTGINNQTVWQCMLFMYINKHFIGSTKNSV